MWCTKILLVLSAAFVQSFCAADEHSGLPEMGMSIFLLVGQSNMSGRGELSDLREDDLLTSERIYTFTNSGNWAPAEFPVDANLDQVDTVSWDRNPGVGPALFFAKGLLDENQDQSIGLVPCAKGGTSIMEWLPNYSDRDDRDTLYGNCLARAIEAQANGEIVGIIYHQGESDGFDKFRSFYWDRQFVMLINSLRSDLNIDQLPVVFAQIGRLTTQEYIEKILFWDEVKESQAKVDIPMVSMVNPTDLDIKSDGIHLTTDAQRALGLRYARAMEALLAKAPMD